MIQKEYLLGLLSDLCFIHLLRTAEYRGDYKGASLFVATDLHKWDTELPQTEALTFGDCIVFRTTEELKNPETLNHELAHVQQIKDAGGNLVFFPKYWVGMLKAWFRTGDPWNNEYEALAEREATNHK